MQKKIVQLALCSMDELYQLVLNMNCDLAEMRTVRISLVEFLANTVLINLLKINYLDEQREYKYIAEILDDVYILLNRRNILADNAEYTKMYELLGMIDERLKTIRVVYQPLSKTPKPLSLNYTHDPVKFQEVSNFIIDKIRELDTINRNSRDCMNMDNLKRKLATVCTVFEYIVENIVFIGTSHIFRKQGRNNPNGWSFMQITIRRCKMLIEEVKRQLILTADKELQFDMKKTINLLEHAQVMMGYYYRNYVYEPEPLTQILNEPNTFIY